MNEILRFLAREVASGRVFTDAHIEEGKAVKIRVPGGWVSAEFGDVSASQLSSLLEQVDREWAQKIMDGVPISQTLDLRKLDISDFRLRCSAYGIEGLSRVSVSVRPIARVPLDLDNANLPPLVHTYTKAPKGLLLVTGPTGAGKTTTIMALLTKMLELRPMHVVTIEDPIEYLLDEHDGIVSQREVGRDVRTFSDGLRDAMRQRPDAIMVGEIRDPETAVTALRAAESGHFVVATMHARSCVGAIQKFQTLAGAEAMSLGYILQGVIAQVLVSTKDGSKQALAVELLNCLDREVQQFVARSEWSKLEECLIQGSKGCQSLNFALEQLIRNKSISLEDAAAATYDVAGLSRRR